MSGGADIRDKTKNILPFHILFISHRGDDKIFQLRIDGRQRSVQWNIVHSAVHLSDKMSGVSKTVGLKLT